MVEKGGHSGGSQGGVRSHRELDIVGHRIGLTCEEAGGTLQICFGHLSSLQVHYGLSSSGSFLP